MSSKKIYALSLQAYQEETNTVEHSAWATLAKSIDDAEAQGMAQARKQWPTEKGWQMHDALSVEVFIAFEQSSRDAQSILVKEAAGICH